MWFTGSPISVTDDLLQSSRERVRLSRICCIEMRNAYEASIDRIYQSMDMLQRSGPSRAWPAQADEVRGVFFHMAGGDNAAGN